MKKTLFGNKLIITTLSALLFNNGLARNQENKPSASSHKSSYSFSYSSHGNNHKKTKQSQSYHSSVQIGENGLFDYLKQQLNTDSLDEQKELLIAELTGKNDLPTELTLNNISIGTLYFVTVLINSDKVELSFALDEDAKNGIKIVYSVKEKNIDQAIASAEKIDGSELKKVFNEKRELFGVSTKNFEESIQESHRHLITMQKEFDDMRKAMDENFSKISNFFSSQPQESEKKSSRVKIAGMPTQNTRRSSCWKRKEQIDKRNRRKVCPHCHRHPNDPIECEE